MNTTPKTTKRDFYATLLGLINDAESTNLTGYDYTSLRDGVNKEITNLDKRAEQAKARAAKAKVEGDELRETVCNALTDQPQTIAEILAKVQTATGNTTISSNKIIPRLSQLVDIGNAVRTEVSIKAADGGKSRTLAAYAKAPAQG